MFKHRNSLRCLIFLISTITLFVLVLPVGKVTSAPANPVTFTILQTNDFHGQLEAANADPNKISTPGMARTARVINAIRTAKGAANVLLVDAGDEMQGSLLSNLGDGTLTGKGAPTIATFNQVAYDVATFGNHEFDWGQTVLGARTGQATYPFVTANIVKNDTGDCGTAGWTKPDFAFAPYVIKTMGTAPNQVKVAFIGLTTLETPTITIATATAGLCFKDPTLSIEHYYSQMKGDGADVIVVLSHLGYVDGGYGYGLPVYGDQTLAKNLITDGDPVNLIIGGHSHTSVSAPGTKVTVTGKTASTLVTQAAYNGRRVGQADITVGTDGSVSINWTVTVWTQQNLLSNPVIPASVWRTFTTSSAYTEDSNVSADAGVAAVINTYANDPKYLALVNQPIGYSAVDLGRNNGTADNMMATFVDDAIYNYLNTDNVSTNDIDIFFNNAGGIRTDWCYVNGAWQTAGCTVSGLHNPALLTYGNMFTILPFGNATVVGQMTGTHILEVLNQGPLVSNGVIQVAGLKYSYYKYTDILPPGSLSSPYPYAWGAYDVQVYDKGSYKGYPDINPFMPQRFQHFNPFFIVSLTPLVIVIFAYLNKKGKEPSAPRKIGIGMLITAFGFLLLVVSSLGLPSPKQLGGHVAPSGSLVSVYWLVGTYFMLTIAELFLSPMGISFVSKVAPPKYKGLMQGGWLASTAIGTYLVGVAGYLWMKVPLWSLWSVLVVACLISAAFMFMIMKRLERTTKF